jgi:hypothetical protein
MNRKDASVNILAIKWLGKQQGNWYGCKVNNNAGSWIVRLKGKQCRCKVNSKAVTWLGKQQGDLKGCKVNNKVVSLMLRLKGKQ